MAARNHYPELDGIRGVAILLVMVTHYVGYEAWSLVDRVAVKAAGIGWIGVDLFFVLSGFLITGILLDTRASTHYWSTFYSRRALRILPLYFAMILGLLAVAYVVAPEAADSGRWRGAQAWYWSYAVNWLIALRADWTAAPLNTAHLWSLAIEEQFYIVWPFFVWGLSRRRLMGLCLAASGGVLALRLGLRLAGVDPISLFVATPTRIDALLLGVVAAILVRGETSRETQLRLGQAAAIIGGAVTGVSMLVQQHTHPYGLVMGTVGFTGIAVACTGVVLMARTAEATSIVRRALRSRVLVFFGVYSYALYMFHQFGELIVQGFFPPLAALPTIHGIVLPWVLVRAGCAAALSVAIALLTWHAVEKRFLALKPMYHERDTIDPSRPLIASESMAD